MIYKNFYITAEDLKNQLPDAGDIEDIMITGTYIGNTGKDLYIGCLVETVDGRVEFKDHAIFRYKINTVPRSNET